MSLHRGTLSPHIRGELDLCCEDKEDLGSYFTSLTHS